MLLRRHFPCLLFMSVNLTRALRNNYKMVNTETIQAPKLPMNNPGRSYSKDVQSDNPTVDYEYVKNIITNNDAYLIDVREPDEIKEHGKIPNSVNIPLGIITEVLTNMSEKDFQNTYKKPKPSKSSELVFYCRSGRRAGMAQQCAMNIGYKNTKSYQGSWNDWISKQK